MNRSRSQVVLIPSYNTGPKLVETVAGALANWRPVWVVIDGSDDGSDAALSDLPFGEDDLRVLHLPRNSGKGAAVLAGMRLAAESGYSQALVMDADGQHPVDRVQQFMQIAAENPDAMVLGVPQFGPDAPAARRRGRKIGNWWANFETLWGGIEDSLFGLRVYPISETLSVLQSRRAGRRYDFDTIAVVRLHWAGVRPINIPVPVRYFSRSEGGISHFRYWRDNLLLVLRHAGLVLEMPLRCVQMLRDRRRCPGCARPSRSPSEP